jgi:micrococcal nuclease
MGHAPPSPPLRLPSWPPRRGLAALVLLLLSWMSGLAFDPAAAQTLSGQLQRVVDGDSFWLQGMAQGKPSAKPQEVRMQGIDAPEACQAWGQQSREALQAALQGQTLEVRTQGKDQHGRWLGTVWVGSININARQVQEGHAWSARYRWDQGPYVKEERQAQALRRGLHEDRQAILPRQFRERHGPCQPGQGVPPKPAISGGAGPLAAGPLRCDGRTHCSQMRSCEEAKFFLANCPGTQMDGNKDGVPCERQWCTR